MNYNRYVVRIVKPSPEPALPKADPLPEPDTKPNSLSKPLYIIAGSGLGVAAGMVIHLTLRTMGISFGGLESSVIIGLPAILGVITSFAIHL